LTPARKTQKATSGTRHDAVDDGTRGQLTKERILNATARILTDRGYAGTRLRDIAKLAEVQAPAIYYYFTSREELIELVVSRGQRAAREHVERGLTDLPSGTAPIERLRCAVEAHLRIVLELSGFTTAAIRNAGQLPEAMRARIQAEHRSYGELWQKLFVDAQAAGEIRSDVNPTYARLLILGALNWSPEWWSSKLGNVEDLAAVSAALIGGLIPTPESALLPDGTSAG